MTAATPVVERSTLTCLEPQYPTPTTPTRIPAARTSHPRLPQSRGLGPLEFFPYCQQPRRFPDKVAPPHEPAELRQIRVTKTVTADMSLVRLLSGCSAKARCAPGTRSRAQRVTAASGQASTADRGIPSTSRHRARPAAAREPSAPPRAGGAP